MRTIKLNNKETKLSVGNFIIEHVENSGDTGMAKLMVIHKDHNKQLTAFIDDGEILPITGEPIKPKRLTQLKMKYFFLWEE